MKHPLLRLGLLGLAFLLVAASYGWRIAQHDDLPTTLQGVTPPLPDNLSRFIVNQEVALQLGKSLFWDMQAGSDGIQTCASCHFHAGADNRIKNQISPAGKSSDDLTFTFGGPNFTLSASDFPLPTSANEVISSQGVFHALFLGVTEGQEEDDVDPLDDEAFSVNGIETRRVEPRNTPTTINAIFNFRNLWDGRANNIFTGLSPFGPRDDGACVWIDQGGSLVCEPVALNNASLASVAVGPPMDFNEMASVGREFALIGRKLLSLQPLAKQRVHPDDSVLGPLADPSGGLTTTYRALIDASFASDLVGDDLTVDGLTQVESNFSLFWGLSVMLYLSTQVSDQAPFDAYVNGNPGALTERQKRGFDIFVGKGQCAACHGGPEFTMAGTRMHEEAASGGLVERGLMGDGSVAIYDEGFFNVGIRPPEDDLGVARDDDFGNPLAYTTQYLDSLLGVPLYDKFYVDPCSFEELVDANCMVNPDPTEEQPLALKGAVKTPGLRNIALTAPYFRNGSHATLMQVVEFFDRGGDFREEEGTYLGPHIKPLGLTKHEKEALVDFMLALTDERVLHHRAPFDHPQIFVPNGHPGDHTQVTDAGNGQATTALIEIPAIGKHGVGMLPPVLHNFNDQLGLSHFDGAQNGQTAIAFPPNVVVQAAAFWPDGHGQIHPVVGTYNFGVFRGLPGHLWVEANNGLPRPLIVNDILVTSGNDLLLATWGHAGLYRSTDGGHTWREVVFSSTISGLPTLVYALDEAADRVLYASAGQGQVFRSRDGGRTWEAAGALPGGAADRKSVV